MTSLDPPPPNPDRDIALIGVKLSTHLIDLLVAAWADGLYDDARDDVRRVLLTIKNQGAAARGAGRAEDGGWYERVAEELVRLWADSTHDILNAASGHPAWEGLADRLHDSEPAAPLGDAET